MRVLISFLLLQASLYARSHDTLPWKDLPPIEIPRVKKEAASFDTFSGALLTDRDLLLAAEKAGKPVILRYSQNGERREDIYTTAVRGFAFDPEKKEVFVRYRDEIQVLDSESLQVVRKFAFARTGGWADIAVYRGRLFALDSGKLQEFNIQTGQVSGTPLAVPLEKPQRILSCGGQMFSWSSYSGAKLTEFIPGEASAPVVLSASVPHRAFFRVVCAGTSIGVADPINQVFTGFTRVGSQLVPAQAGTQTLEDGVALRHSPRTDDLSFVLSVRAESDMPLGRVAVVAIPPATAAMSIENESFAAEGEVREDESGNRLFFVSLPALRKGEEFKSEIYSARITRYKLDFALKPDRLIKGFSPGRAMQMYLSDSAEYKMDDPLITSLRDEIRAKHPTIEGFMNGVYSEVRRRLVYKQDGRFDAAPVVLRQGHGSCTEHSYAQIALLRSAGIPARMAWNWLPKGNVPELNHKIAEAWHPVYGWIPMEPLAPPRSSAGTTYAQHLVFSVLLNAKHSTIRGGDTLASLSGSGMGRASLSVQIELKPVGASRGMSVDDQDNQAGSARERGGERVVE
jgi:hypothetical protein